MKITINGTLKNLEQATNLRQLIDQLCPNPQVVIAELNEHIIKSPKWNDTVLQDNDKVELITFVGGG